MTHDLHALADAIGRERVAYCDDACLLIRGKWQDCIGELPVVDAVITDPPYSERTHAGGTGLRKWLEYAALSPDAVRDLIQQTASAPMGWCCYMTDSELAPTYRLAADGLDRYTFPPVPLLAHQPRLGGDGPGSGVVWLCVSRPRSRRFSAWGSLPCWYRYVRTVSEVGVIGAKPIPLMRALVRDYSRPGDLILDPCAGGATTLLAARLEGRQCIGVEMDPNTCELAAHRLRPYAGRRREGQIGLFDVDPDDGGR